MQGPGSSVTPSPENINFDRGSAPDEHGIEPQVSWNSMQSFVPNRLPEYRLSSNETNIQYLQHVRRDGQNPEWSLGESSSSSSLHQGDQNERKKECTWSFRPQASLALEDHRQYGQSNVVSLDNGDENPNGNQTTNGSFILHNPGSNALPQDLNMISGFVDEEDDDCQVLELPSSYMSIGPSTQWPRSTGSSSDSLRIPSGFDGGYDGREDRPGRRMSCKRKALEVHTGQSSGVGGLNCFQNDERSQWHTNAAPQVASSNANMPEQTDNDIVISNGSEQANPRLRLGVGGAVSASPFSFTSPENVETSRRNFRLRINGLYQQEPIPENPFSTETNVGNVDVPSSRSSSRLRSNHLFDLNPAPPVETGSLHRQSVLHAPSVRRHHQSRWSGASSSRSSRSSAAAIPDERNAAPFGEPTSRIIPRSISEHPMFVPPPEMGSLPQNPTNWSLPGGNNSIAGFASTSRAGPSTGTNSSAPSWSHRNPPQYPRRLSEIVRRSLLSSAGAESGGQSSNHGVRPSSSSLSQEMALPSGSENHVHRLLNSRSALLDRHLNGAYGMPYSLRTLASAGEGRGSIMSEQIRHVLDLMRRGEGLRYEDVMLLDHSVFFGMADIHDRHRDMRLDVDNMSYEELLSLEERIGNVCTGLTEETITTRLKQKKHVESKADDPVETDPCSICREEYNVGEDLGSLECGHDFHRDCIKQWLMQKNLCPICKTTGLNT